MQLKATKRTKVFVNGASAEITAASLAELVAELGYAEGAVATALNGAFVARHARAATQLAAEDHVEIVAPRQGG